MRVFGKTLGLVGLALMLVLGSVCSNAIAHDFWLDVKDYTPQIGDKLTLTLGYGHYFPSREFMPNESLEKIYMLAPDGSRMKVKRVSEVEFKSVKNLEKEGTYIVVGQRKGGFFTKTTEGYKRGYSKKGLKNVIKCVYSEKYAKAIISVGKGKGGVFSRILGYKLEIVPLVDPSSLKEGDYMPVKVVYDGKPLKGEYIFGTYMGFSTDKNAFAYATKTDEGGVAKVKIIKSGIWLIVVKHIVPYPDPEECDKISCSSTLTFEVR